MLRTMVGLILLHLLLAPGTSAQPAGASEPSMTRAAIGSHLVIQPIHGAKLAGRLLDRPGEDLLLTQPHGAPIRFPVSQVDSLWVRGDNHRWELALAGGLLTYFVGREVIPECSRGFTCDANPGTFFARIGAGVVGSFLGASLGSRIHRWELVFPHP